MLKNFFLHMSLCFFTVVLTHAAPHVIVLYGTSCAGKSTFANRLQENLGHNWQVIDWDEYAAKHGDDLASAQLIQDLTHHMLNGKDIIIDAQPCLDLGNTLEGYETKTILLYAPLKTLIQRDAARDLLLQRPERRSRYARAYIYETFFQLYTAGDLKVGLGPVESEKLLSRPNPTLNILIDEIYPSDVPSDLIDYPLNENTYNFFEQIRQNTIPVPIYTKRKYDLIIYTDPQVAFGIDFAMLANW